MVQFYVFLGFCASGMILLIGGAAFGHDHDFSHDHDMGGHDHDHGDNNNPTISIFSTKVIATFIMTFGAVGAIASYSGCNVVVSSLLGILGGTSIGGIMFGFLRYMYSQQSTSSVETTSLVNCTGTVTVPLDAGGLGQVEVSKNGQRLTYTARNASADPIAKGHAITVTETHGSTLVVKEIAKQ